MTEVLIVLRREFVCLWYYFSVQLEQIAHWWVLGLGHFALYLLFVMAFSLATGLVVNLLV